MAICRSHQARDLESVAWLDRGWVVETQGGQVSGLRQINVEFSATIA